MLKESELAWLEHRDAMQFLTGTYIADFAEYPLWNSGKDWQDAAEFEARVAAKLATLLDESYFHIDTGSYESCREVCPAHSLCPKGFNPDCRATFVKYARLVVEEEEDVDR